VNRSGEIGRERQYRNSGALWSAFGVVGSGPVLKITSKNGITHDGRMLESTIYHSIDPTRDKSAFKHFLELQKRVPCQQGLLMSRQITSPESSI
jgi:hypothetical protein